MLEPQPFELAIERNISASPAKLFRAWTEPALLKRWFTPRPVTTPIIENDVRPGGSQMIVMEMADGTRVTTRGIFLEVVPNKKLVFTDAFVAAWIPSEKPFMVGTITFEPVDATTTLYRAVASHWTSADRDVHIAMGFHAGWSAATDQLEAVVATLADERI